METQIREATAVDIKPLVVLSRKTILDNYSSFLGDQAVTAYIESGAVDQYVADNIQRCIVIVEDGEALGYSITKKNLIDLMMVDTDYHRRGLGTSLLRHVRKLDAGELQRQRESQRVLPQMRLGRGPDVH